MALSSKTVRKQLNLLKPLLNSASLKTIRRGQNKIGELMESLYRGQVLLKTHRFEQSEGAWVMPRDERREDLSRGAPSQLEQCLSSVRHLNRAGGHGGAANGAGYHRAPLSLHRVLRDLGLSVTVRSNQQACTAK